MPNPFEDLASSATRTTQKKMQRAAKQPMVPTAREKAYYDKQTQLRHFQKWKRQIRQGLESGHYGLEIIVLLKLLRTIPDSEILVDFVRQAEWLLTSEQWIKDEVLGYIMSCMARWNVRHGLPPFNDSLPDQPDNPSVAVLKLLRENIHDRKPKS